jgi:hypothetical protein
MSFVNVIFLAYLVTIVSETMVLLVWQRPRELWWWMTGIVLVNSFTHPIAIYLIQIKGASFFLVEIGVFITEAIWYKFAFSQNFKHALTLSAVANITSIATGILIRYVLGT